MREKVFMLLICSILLSYGAEAIVNNGVPTKIEEDVDKQNSGFLQGFQPVTSSRSSSSIIVDYNGNGDYNTIQDAIDNVSKGTTIYVWAGVYDGSIIINKTLTLIGNGTLHTIINGSGIGNAAYISANNTIMSGFSVTGSGLDTSHDAGIKLHKVYNCSIYSVNCSNNLLGIYIYDSNNNQIYNNNISNNTQGITIRFCHVYDNIIEFNSIFKNQIGISILDTTMPGPGKGISTGNILSNNFIFENTIGISLEVIDAGGIEQVKILSSYIYKNDVGIEFANLGWRILNVTIANCTIEENQIGIKMYQIYDTNYVVYNKFSKNIDFAIYLDNSEYNYFHHNNFINNNQSSVQAYDNSNKNYWNDTAGEGNYWSDYELRYPNAVNDSHIWDTPYEIYGSDGAKDYYPLVENVSRVPIYFKPQAMIEFITPNPCEYGQEVSFKGIGTDEDGVIINYRWGSDLDGLLSNDSSFKSSIISIGNHNISFSVQDDHGLWSEKVTEILKILKQKINITHFPHKSIRIIGNENFTEENGVVGGLGIKGDPFIIEGWEINCSGENCIYIENTTAYFNINDCHLYNENGTDLFVGPAGIYLNNVENGVIKNITCYQINGTNITPKQILDDIENIYFDIIDDSYFGTYLLNSKSIEILDCNFSNIYGGINLRNSNSNTIKNNICNSNFWHSISLSDSPSNIINNNSCNSNLGSGIQMWFSENNRISKNTCNSNGYAGIELGMSDSNYIDENTCNSNRHQWAIFLTQCNNSYIRNNICQNNLWGIALSESHSNLILNNNLNFNDINGIYISGSNSNTIKNNTCLNNGNGIFLHGSNENIVNDNICMFNNYTGLGFGSSDHNIIEQNNFSNNKFGIYLDIVTIPYSDSKNNKFSTNIISKNTKLGIFIDFRSNNNEFYLNDIISNTQQAIDNATNIWNTSSGFGNFWSDYTGLDNGANGRIAGDGIGDTELPHLGLDYYPLMEPYVENLTLENIRILLELDKFEFIANEPITGSIQIINDNSFNITFLRNRYGFAEPIEYFIINFIDNSEEGIARINKDLSSIKISAFNTMKIEFTFVEYRLENRLLNHLDIGNYSIFALFYYGNPQDWEWIVSNIVEFRIITNKSIPGDEEINGDPTSTSSSSVGLSQAQIFSSIAGLTIVIIIISTLFITSTEVGKFGFFSAIAPLYTKTRKKKKDHEYGYIKGSVRGYILGNPGESYNNIKRILNLPNGTLAYYLKVLERDDIIRSERDGFRRRFYPAKGLIVKDMFDLSDIQRKIKNTIQKLPGISQKEILSHLDISQQKLNYHIQLMVKARIIRLVREGKNTKCYIINETSSKA